MQWMKQPKPWFGWNGNQSEGVLMDEPPWMVANGGLPKKSSEFQFDLVLGFPYFSLFFP